MALALNNLKRVDMPLNKETKPNLKLYQSIPKYQFIPSTTHLSISHHFISSLFHLNVFLNCPLLSLHIAASFSFISRSYGPPHIAEQKQDDQHEHTFSNYVRIRDVVQKTCQRWWTIRKSGERGSGISVLPARHDNDDDDDDISSPTR